MEYAENEEKKKSNKQGSVIKIICEGLQLNVKTWINDRGSESLKKLIAMDSGNFNEIQSKNLKMTFSFNSHAQNHEYRIVTEVLNPRS